MKTIKNQINNLYVFKIEGGQVIIQTDLNSIDLYDLEITHIGGIVEIVQDLTVEQVLETIKYYSQKELDKEIIDLKHEKAGELASIETDLEELKTPSPELSIDEELDIIRERQKALNELNEEERKFDFILEDSVEAYGLQDRVLRTKEGFPFYSHAYEGKYLKVKRAN